MTPGSFGGAFAHLLATVEESLPQGLVNIEEVAVIRIGQVQGEDVKELQAVLPCVKSIFEDLQETIEDQRRLDAIRLDLIAEVNQVLNYRDEHWGLVVCSLGLGLFLTSGVLERRKEWKPDLDSSGGG